MYDAASFNDMVDDLVDQAIEEFGGPLITSSMSRQERCVAEFLWIHQQEEIAQATIEGIEYIADGGLLH